MKIEYNFPLKMNDGNIVRANIYFPLKEGKYPVIFSYGPYGKDLHFSEIYKTAWEKMYKRCPEVFIGSTNVHQSWEVVDPEKWCPDGYICMRVDSRGSGCSEGFMDSVAERERQDMYDLIEWAGTQPWCNGNVGMCGISYYAVSSWNAADAHPPHLKAIIPWEGFCDYYRDANRQGGILCTMRMDWIKGQTGPVQYGRGDIGYKSKATGRNVSGDETWTEAEIINNRIDYRKTFLENPLDNEFYLERKVRDFSKLDVAILSAGNWGGIGYHLRGNVEGFMRAGSSDKYLELHGYEHWMTFYSAEGIALQKKFFGHYLKGEDTGWNKERRVNLKVRHIDKFVQRYEDEFPIARTVYKTLYLNPTHCSLTQAPFEEKASLTYKGMSSEGVTFLTAPFEEETEITGFAAAKLFVSSSTADADMFLVFRLFKPDLTEVTFAGASDPHVPVSAGWLRASQRKLDTQMSTDFRPYHAHDESWPLKPGVPVELDIPIQPTGIVVPKGYRIGLTIRGKDYVYQGAGDQLNTASHVTKPLNGCGRFVHDEPHDRPSEIFDGEVTLHFDKDKQAYIRIPVIPN